jgi:integrase
MSGKLRDGVVKRGASWSFVVRVPDPATGRTRPKWVGGFASESAAKAARDEARVAARRGEYIDRAKVTVRAYLHEWLGGHAASVKPQTWSGYRYDVEHYIVPRIGGHRMQGLRPAIISRFYRDLAESGGRNGRPLGPRTVDRVHRTLRKALNDAVRVEQILVSNPAERAKRPRLGRSEVAPVWSGEQLRTFLAVASGHRLSAFFRVAAYTGARRGELLHLRWSRVDLEAGEVTISGSAAVVDGRRVEGSTKGDRARIVSIDSETVTILREHRARQAAERLIAGPMWTSAGDYVFTTETGGPLYPDTPTQLMPKLITAASLPKIRLHDLRHLHATTLLLSGVPVHVVAARLGHTDPAVTLRVYAHVLREQAPEVADLFAEAMRA